MICAYSKKDIKTVLKVEVDLIKEFCKDRPLAAEGITNLLISAYTAGQCSVLRYYTKKMQEEEVISNEQDNNKKGTV